MAALGWLLNLDFAASESGVAPVVEQYISSGGSYKPQRYRYLTVPEYDRKDYDEEELKRRILEEEERNKEEIELLTRKSEQLYHDGKSIEEITNTVNVIQRQLEERIQTQLLFDIKVELRLLEQARKKKMALLLLMSAA